MSKRRAGNELTRDNWDEEEEKVEAGTFQVADESVLKNRVLRKAKRILQNNESGGPKPIFSGFSGFNNINNNSNSKQAFSFLLKCNETPNESGNHPSTSTINSVSTSSSLKTLENSCSKSPVLTVINPAKVMKLNEAFIKFVTNAVQKNPCCVLTPTLKDYEKQVSKFVNLAACKTNILDSSMTSSKELPQVSSFEDTVTRVKNVDEVKNNSVNVQTSSTNFSDPISNTSSNGKLFKFDHKDPVKNDDELNKIDLKLNKTDKETLESKSQSVSEEKSKNTLTPNSGFNLNDFKFNPQSLSSTSSLTNKSLGFVFDQKTSPLSNTPSFSFGGNTPFSFKPMEQKSDNKPFFSFGSVKPLPVSPNSDPTKIPDSQTSKDEEDEDQPPVVNFTPIKENDAIFESKSKLFCLKNGKYEEHGIGQLYLKPVDDKKIQLLMRNDNALGTIMVNTILNDTVNYTKRNAKNVQLICVIDPTKCVKPQTVLFKFKDSQITDSFEKELEKLKH